MAVPVFLCHGAPKPRSRGASHGIAAYRALIALNGGSFGGLKFRRYSDLNKALDAYQEEKDRHKLDPAAPVQYYYWA